MKILTRVEEMLMVCIWRLSGEAYGVEILMEAEKYTGNHWTLSGIYIPLGRLEKQGLVESYLGEPTKERGGKRKRFYKMTAAGYAALKETRGVQQALWSGLDVQALGEQGKQ